MYRPGSLSRLYMYRPFRASDYPYSFCRELCHDIEKRFQFRSDFVVMNAWPGVISRDLSG
jgi:hypothetical protein